MLSHVVNSPFIHKLNNLIRIFSASSFLALSVIKVLFSLVGVLRKLVGGFEEFNVDRFRMNLLSQTSVLSISKSKGSGLQRLSRAPIALCSLASAINLTVGSLELARIWDLEICRDFRKVFGFLRFKPASGR